MKFGIKLHHSGPGASAGYMKQWAQFAETLGYHLIMTADHIALTEEVLEEYPAPYYEPFTNLAWLAAHTERIELGTTVIVVPYRNPLQLAHLASNLDQLSDGRFIFGVGVGWAKSEFDALGIPFEKRGAITDDYLSAMEEIWANDVASYQGEFVSFRDVMVSPKPVQLPHPPVWVGGSSPPALRRAVRFGNAWHPIGIRTDWLRNEALPRLVEIAERQGKPVPAISPRIFCRITNEEIPEDQRMAGEGTLEQIHTDLVELSDMGSEYVLFDTKRNNESSNSSTHHEEAWQTLAALAETVIDLEGESVR